MVIAASVLADTTCEAIIFEAAGFADHAKITIFAHAPYNREFQVTIPASLGGTNPKIDWFRLAQHPGAGDARFTLDAAGNVTGWAVSDGNNLLNDINYYHS